MGGSPLTAFLDSERIFGFLKYENYLSSVLNEQLFLVKNGFSYRDTMEMTCFIRKYYINILSPKQE